MITNRPPEPTWSPSRAELFHRCRRAYWYRYYLAWGGWFEDAPEESRRAWLLSKLHNRWSWTGNAVHRAIAGWFRGGRAEPPERVEARMVEALRRDFAGSRRGDYRKDPSRIVGLMEHEFGEPVTDEEWSSVVENARTSLKAFFESDRLGLVREASMSDVLDVEEVNTYEVSPGFKVYSTVDLAYRTGDCLVVVDWKTGRRVDAGVDLQLLCYAGWYLSRGWSPEDVSAVAVYLRLGPEVRRVEVTFERLEELRRRVEKDLRAMREVHLRDAAAFPATPGQLCGWCRYRELCDQHPGVSTKG